jgi:TRAP-type C4-dicarboxylate transport system substrate-binding protein
VLTIAGNVAGLAPQIVEYLDEVERRAAGTLRIDFVGGRHVGEADQEVGLIGDVQAGEVDMAWVGARAFDYLGVTSFQALLAPFLVDSYDLQDAVFAAGIPARMLGGLDATGLTGIGVLPGPLRQMLGVDHPFTTPADFVGEVVGTSGGKLAEQTLRALGATPRMQPAESSIDGLDGLDYHLAAIYGNGYFETGKYVTVNLDLWPRPLVIFMNSERFAELNDEQQLILADAAEAAIAPASEAARLEDEEGGVPLCRVGIELVEVSDDERAALLETVAPVYAELEANDTTQAFLAEIRAVKQQTVAAPESLVCPAEPGGPEPAPTPIDGVWRVTTTAEEGRAAGDPEPIPTNYGSWVFVFHNGRFAYTQEAGDSCTWGYGTFSVDGERAEWLFVDAGGIAPGIAPAAAFNKPGERFVFGWSRYRDRLTWTAVPGEVSPALFELKPWRLADENPSADVFAPRCPPPSEALEGIE